MKNIVYRITCNQCNSSYIGETHRTYRTRILEHLKSDSSNVFRHLISHHFQPNIQLIKHQIVMSGFIHTLHRKEFELYTIKNENPLINIQNR